MDRPAKISLDPYGTSNVQLARAALEAKTREFARRSIAKNTERGYWSDWADFLELCDQHGRHELPTDPETVALYCAGLAEAGGDIPPVEFETLYYTEQAAVPAA